MPDQGREGLYSATPLLGREAVLSALRSALASAAHGTGGLCLVTGDAGSGKTSVARELARVAEEQGGCVLWGRCHRTGGAPALWPFVQIIREGASRLTDDELRTDLGAGAPEVLAIVPELRERFCEVPEPSPLAVEARRFRQFDSLASVLGRVAARRLLVVVLENLEQVDEVTIRLLLYLAREVTGSRLLVVGTLRDGEVGQGHPLSGVLGTLAGEARHGVFRLRGLEADDVRTILQRVTGQQPKDIFVDRVLQITGGNPLFVHEVARFLVEHPAGGDVTIPPNMRAMIALRLGQLSEDCRHVLRIGAVFGPTFRLGCLEAVADLNQGVLAGVLDEALRARILTCSDDDLERYRFAYLGLRQALYENLPTIERKRLHRRIGEVLEGAHRTDPDARAAEVAHHFLQAGNCGHPEKAVSWAWRAGDEAASLLGYEEAARWYCCGAEGESETTTRSALRRAQADALWRAGKLEDARAAARDAVRAAREAGDPETFARAALALAGRQQFFRTVEYNEETTATLREALEMLPHGDSALRAMIAAKLADELSFADPEDHDGSESAPLLREASEIVRRVGDPDAEIEVLRATHWARWGPTDLDGRHMASQRYLLLADRIHDASLRCEGYLLRFSNLLELGEVDASSKALARCRRLGEQLRQPCHDWVVRTAEACLASAVGQLDELGRLAERAFAVGGQLSHPNVPLFFGVQLAYRAWMRGEFRLLETALDGIWHAFPVVRPAVRAALALASAEQGRLDEARNHLHVLAANRFAGLPRNVTWLPAVSLLAEAAAILEERDAAADLYDILLPFRHRVVTLPPMLVFGPATHSLGVLAGTAGMPDEALDHFEDALRQERRGGMRHWLARTQLAYASWLLAHTGDRDPSDLIASTLEVARDLRMEPVCTRALAAGECAQARRGAPKGAARGSLYKEGSRWTWVFGSERAILEYDYAGCTYMGWLLQRPERPMDAIDLIRLRYPMDPEVGPLVLQREIDSGSDDRARRALYEEIKRLRRREKEFQEEGDDDGAARARAEWEDFWNESKTQLMPQWKGDSSRLASAAIYQVVKRVRKELVKRKCYQLASYLQDTLKVRATCIYLPDPARAVVWDIRMDA